MSDWSDCSEVEYHDVEWGAVRLGFCPDCLVTHEWVNVYTFETNPLYAVLLGTLWLCDDDEDIWEDEGDEDEC